MTKSIAIRRVYMKRRLYSYKFSEYCSFDEQLNEFKELVAELEDIEGSLEDEDKAIILLNALPRSFRTRSFQKLKDAFFCRRKKSITLMEVESSLQPKSKPTSGGVRFTLLKYLEHNLHYFSFNEMDLKDYARLSMASGFSVVSSPGERIVDEDFPEKPGFCRVGGALFIVGGSYDFPDEGYIQTKWLWSAPPPPIPNVSFIMTWTLCATAMKSSRSNPMLVPLNDGRIFICGGTKSHKCWIEIYDPKNGEFDSRDLPAHIFNPFPTSCFQLADQLVMLYYHNKEVIRPSLVLYDMGRNNWEIFAENLPIPKSDGMFYKKKRNLIYVGGNILFIIDRASRWFVYDLSAKKVAGKVDVRVKDREVMQALYLSNSVTKTTSWLFYIFLVGSKWPLSDVRYAKVEVVQGKGGGYISTVRLSGVLEIGEYENLYIIDNEVSRGGGPLGSEIDG